MKKIICIALAAVMALSLAACGGTQTQQVSTDGSTSMQKVIGSLKEAFEVKNEGIEVSYNGSGSGAGIKAVQSGTCDIGLSSRNLKAEEIKAGLKGTVLAYDGIAVIVNPENTVEDLTVEQIAAIYTGEITNWSEVGGNDAEIVHDLFKAAAGTRACFTANQDDFSIITSNL